MEHIRILIAAGGINLRNNLKQLLIRGGYYVVSEVEDGHQVLQNARSLRPDLVVVEYELSGINGFEVGKNLIEDRIAPVLLITQEVFFFSKFIGEMNKMEIPVSYVAKPLSENNLFPAIECLLRHYRYFLNLESEIKNLKKKLEIRKIVERAKGILMQQFGYSEAEAYRRIQKQSMDKCFPIEKIAEAIIIAYEMKK